MILCSILPFKVDDPHRIICVHATTTNRTIASGNAAAAVRDTQRRATDEAPPTK